VKTIVCKYSSLPPSLTFDLKKWKHNKITPQKLRAHCPQ
jgi:hypothetical protein